MNQLEKKSLLGRKLALAATALTLPLTANAASLFTDDFNTDTSGGYDVLAFVPGRDGANFAYDYSAVGIPEAPNSTGGGTTGVQMFANNPSGATTNGASAVQIVPQGLAATLGAQPYRLSVDLWMNYNGAAPGGGTGSTEAFMAGVGWDGSSAIEVGNFNGSYFTVTGDGGSSTDVRTFSNGNFNGSNSGPSNNSSDGYYAGIFPGGIDIGLLPGQGGVDSQTGITSQGQMAFSWHEIRIDVVGDSSSFYIDDLLIASDPNSDRTGNIMLGYADFFSSESGSPQWSFGVYDNLNVETIPEPATGVLFGLGMAGFLLRRRR